MGEAGIESTPKLLSPKAVGAKATPKHLLSPKNHPSPVAKCPKPWGRLPRLRLPLTLYRLSLYCRVRTQPSRLHTAQGGTCLARI